MSSGNSGHKDKTYFINAFFLMKGTRQEEAGHGVLLLSEENKILPNAHWAPEKETENRSLSQGLKAHLKRESTFLAQLSMTRGSSSKPMVRLPRDPTAFVHSHSANTPCYALLMVSNSLVYNLLEQTSLLTILLEYIHSNNKPEVSSPPSLLPQS